MYPIKVFRSPITYTNVAQNLLMLSTSYVYPSKLHRKRQQILFKYLEKLFTNGIIVVQHILAKKKKPLDSFLRSKEKSFKILPMKIDFEKCFPTIPAPKFEILKLD